MNGNSKQNKLGKEEIMKILEENGWSSDYPQMKQVKLYREYNEEAGNCFMKRGIIAFKDNKTIIVEIEKSTPTPHNLIGTIGCIDISNYYKNKEGKLQSLKDVTFFIIISEEEKTKKKETTKEQIETINNYFKVEKGSLKDFRVMTIDEFENQL
jgi:hypothetical protein